MFEPLDLTRMAHSLASYAGARLGIISRNIAQADTPGYKAMDLPDFQDVYAAQTGDSPFVMKATLPGHLTGAAYTPDPIASPSGGEASVDGNTVSIEKEMVKMADIRQSHDMALSVYSVTRDISRAALGRK